MWEVTASPSVDVPPRAGEGEYVSARAPAVEPLAQPRGQKAQPRPAPDDVPSEKVAARIGRQMGEIRRMIQALIIRSGGDSPPDMPAPLRELHAHLLAQDVASRIASELIQELHLKLNERQLTDAGGVRAGFAEVLESRISVAPPERPSRSGRPRVIALIGPTGVGKTTTIAKLAADYKLRAARKVGLITVDTYRIAAVDQLRTYAEIIEVPVRVVLTPGELHQAVRSMGDRDVVLIDTAGRSQNNEMRISQLQGLLSAAKPDEVHLVVSAASSQRVAERAIERFGPLGVNRVVLSKLDEAETFGMVVNVPTSAGRPLSYVTTGQDVPDDLAPARARQLAGWLLDGSIEAGPSC
jgi:flagellar biosynthesis protein FlhF